MIRQDLLEYRIAQSTHILAARTEFSFVEVLPRFQVSMLFRLDTFMRQID